MLSFAPEVERFRADGLLDDATAARLIAVERREVFPVFNELRFLTWAGVMLIAAGASILVAHHLQDIGPLIIAGSIGIAAAACYAYAEWKRRKRCHSEPQRGIREGASGEPPPRSLAATPDDTGIVDDFILLLASLLLSADIGYIEYQWHVLGSGWPRHLLVLAIIHAVVAYRFDSRLVLSLSISSLAAYLGIDRRMETLFDSPVETGMRAFFCSALLFAWREIDRRRRRSRTFQPVFDHFATNLAFWGALVLMTHNESRQFGCILAMLLAVASARHGLRVKEELFVAYAWIYGTIAIDVFVADSLHNDTATALFIVFSSIGAIVGLFVTHAHFRRAVA